MPKDTPREAATARRATQARPEMPRENDTSPRMKKAKPRTEKKTVGWKSSDEPYLPAALGKTDSKAVKS